MHISQLPSGRWRVIVQQDGQRRSATADTRAAAQRRGAELVIELGAEPSASDVTVGELLELHLAEHGYRPTSLDDYRYIVAKLTTSVEPWVARRVRDVTPVSIDGLYRQLERDGWSPHRIRKLNSLLSSAFKRAKRWGWIAANPCRDADVPPEPEPDLHPVTAAEAKILLACADAFDPDFGLFARIAAITGARRAEILGLQRRDVITDTCELLIRRAATFSVSAGFSIEDVKTGPKGRRRIALTPALVARIDAHRRAQDRRAFAAGIRLDAEAWLFTAGWDRPWNKSRPTHWWADVRSLAARVARHVKLSADEVNAEGITRARLHDLRHYVASEANEAGFDARAIGDRLGQRRVATTLERYAASRPARDRALAEHLERQLGA